MSTERTREEIDEFHQQLISTLPISRGLLLDIEHQYEGFWYHPTSIKGILLAKNQSFYNSTSSSSDNVLLASYPKSGTTWLKSLLFAVKNRVEYPTDCTDHPLLISSPHECVPFIEFHAYINPLNPVPENTSLLSTHIPFQSLPDSVKSSDCRIVYVYREPKDVFISMWHFAKFLNSKETELDSNKLIPFEEAVDLFCQGKTLFGPYWDHVLSFWEESLSSTTPKRILFVSYEELKSKPIHCLKEIASFIGKPFSEEEDKAGVPENIVQFCSFNKMKDLEVNQPQSLNKPAEPNGLKMSNDLFFRKGEVGDYQNYMTEEMIDRINKIMKQKLGEAGFPASFLSTI